MSDAGAIRYFGEHRVVDLVGLNTHRLLPLVQAAERAPRDEHPEEGCALSGLRLEEGRKYDVVSQPLEGHAPYTVELVFFAEPEC